VPSAILGLLVLIIVLLSKSPAPGRVEAITTEVVDRPFSFRGRPFYFTGGFMKRTGADVVVEALKAEKVDILFGFPGGRHPAL